METKPVDVIVLHDRGAFGEEHILEEDIPCDNSVITRKNGLSKKKKDVLEKLKVTQGIFPNIRQYKDTEDTDSDTLLHCPECGAKWGGTCPLHGFLHFVTDVSIPRDVKNKQRAQNTAPYVVNICALPGKKISVCAREAIFIRTRFGPYEGEDVSVEGASAHAWLIRKDGKPDHCIDAKRPGLSNWMRYVKSSPRKDAQNLLAYQHHGKLYYMAIRYIPQGEELLVWCGSKYKPPQDDSSQVLGEIWQPDDVRTHIKFEIHEDIMDQLSQEVLENGGVEDLAKEHNGSQLSEESPQVNGKVQKLSQGVLQEASLVKMEVTDDISEAGCNIGQISQMGAIFTIKEEVLTEVASQVISGGDVLEGERRHGETSQHVKMKISEDAEDLNPLYLSEVNRNPTKTTLHQGKYEDSSDEGGISCNTKTKAEVVGPGAHGSILHGDRLIIPQRRHIFACTFCDKRFSRKCKLDRHVQIHDCDTQSESTKMFSCEVCKKAFSRKASLMQHLRVHSDEKRFACDQCGHRFALVGNLKAHMLAHTGVWPFICNYPNCARGFIARNSYHKHLERHKNRKLFTCPKCLIEVASQVYLDFHLRRTACCFLPYICPKCRKAFKEQVQFKEHSCLPDEQQFASAESLEVEPAKNYRSTYISKKAYHCSECELKCESRNELYEHFRLSHTPSRYAFCNECNKVYTNTEILRRHIRRVHCQERPFVCTVCNKCYFTNNDLARHFVTHSGKKPFSCKSCDKTFSSQSELTKHLNFHTKAITCTQCGKQYSTYYVLQKHIRRKHASSKLFNCTECAEEFTSYTYLQNHLVFHTSVKESVKTWERESNENSMEHLNTDSTKEGTCPDCKKVFSDKYKLLTHIRRIHAREGYACYACNKKFHSYQDLEGHLRTHPNDKPHVCLECNRGFVYQSHLAQHQLSHNKDRPFACSFCKRRFWTKATCKAHVCMRTTGKSHVCSECKESFTRRRLLRAHVRTHDKDKPFVCPVCQKGFSESHRLKKHLRYHMKNKEKIFACNQCDKLFAQEHCLQEHVQSHRPFEFVEC